MGLIAGCLLQVVVSWSLTIQPTALTYHGVASDQDLQSIRRRGNAIDDAGRLTYHHSIGVTARDGSFQYSANYFRNSVNRSAGSVMLGPAFPFFHQSLYLGLVGGVYFRDPMEDMKIPGSIKTSQVEMAPMLLLTGSLAFRLYKSVYFELMGGSNYVLSFFAPGIRIKI